MDLGNGLLHNASGRKHKTQDPGVRLTTEVQLGLFHTQESAGVSHGVLHHD